MNKYLIATDLDGTILPAQGKISRKDIDTLHHLRQEGHITVIATGRLHHDILTILPADFPADYIVFSMGNGILEWNTREIIYQRSLPKAILLEIIESVSRYNTSFSFHLLPPHSEIFYYRRNGRYHADFERRLSRKRPNGRLLRSNTEIPEQVAQLLIMVDSELDFQAIEERIAPFGVEVNRSTSPVDHQSIWIEIFSKGVNKAAGLRYLAERLNIPESNVVAVGNDYNDLDMLAYAGTSFLVSNAPMPLRDKYTLTDSVGKQGFSQAIHSLSILETTK